MSTTTPIATESVVDVPLADVEADPYPLYAWMRRECPIAWVPETGRLWITTYRLCREAGENDRVFGPTQEAFNIPYGDPNVMSLMGEEHRASRATLETNFRPRAVTGYVDSILRATAVRYIEAIRERGAIDINSGLLEPIAVRSIGKVMGLDDLDDATLSRWFRALSDYNVDVGRHEEITAKGEATKDEIRDYLAGRLEQIERREDETTLTMMFTHGMPGGEIRSIEEVIGNVATMIVGGFQEPAHGAANTLLGLLGRPEQAAAVAADPSKLSMQAIQEGLRWIAPFSMFEKLTYEDVEIGGVLVPAQTEIALCLGSANRDEKVFEQPDVYDLYRDRRRPHVSFGYGEHLCVGHYVARQLGKVCLEEIFTRLPTLRLDDRARVDGSRRQAVTRTVGHLATS